MKYAIIITILSVGGVMSQPAIDLSNICAKISREVDDFTDEVTISSPLFDDDQIQNMIVMKHISKANTSYFLRLTTIGNTVNVSISGVIILFTDGTKISKPSEPVDVEVDDDGFEYSSFINLSQSEMKSLSTKEIRKFRLYIYDQEVSQIQSMKLKAYAGCLINSK